MSFKNVLENKLNSLRHSIDKLFLPRVINKDVCGSNIFIFVENSKELRRVRSYEKKEPNTIKWLKDSIKSGDILYDIGANIGLYSIFPAIFEPKCKVFSFEPESLNFAKLNKNIFLNKLSSRVKAYPIAFTDSIKLDNFFINKFSVGNALHSFGRNINNMGKEFKPEHIQGVMGLTLDYLVFDLGLEFPNYIKIDVDGIEKDIVSGGKKVFSDPRVNGVLVEISKDEFFLENRKWFNDFFSSHGFVACDYEDIRKDTENLIFQRK
ncbi:MAG TPA: FkbM family methyltransferase [Candidatus Paceibacterota bacterium]